MIQPRTATAWAAADERIDLGIERLSARRFWIRVSRRTSSGCCGSTLMRRWIVFSRPHGWCALRPGCAVHLAEVAAVQR